MAASNSAAALRILHLTSGRAGHGVQDLTIKAVFRDIPKVYLADINGTFPTTSSLLLMIDDLVSSNRPGNGRYFVLFA